MGRGPQAGHSIQLRAQGGLVGKGDSLAAGAGQRGGLPLEPPRGGLTAWTPGQDFLLCSDPTAGLAEF